MASTYPKAFGTSKPDLGSGPQNLSHSSCAAAGTAPFLALRP
jgi:hypothetical protein